MKNRSIHFDHLFTLLLIIIVISSSISSQNLELLEDAFASSIASSVENGIEGIVTSVIDGDTLNIRTNIDKEILTIRLVLVDAPEINEEGYTEAKEFVSENCLDKLALVDLDDNQDLSYGRLVALVYCQGLNINEAVIQSGLASIYQRFCTISEFGNSDWAQKHGCNGFINAYNDNKIATLRGENDTMVEETVSNCDSSYPDICIPSPPPDLDCKDVKERNFTVRLPEPHRFDGNKDGVGCES
jgi:micrococcal nuclease